MSIVGRLIVVCAIAASGLEAAIERTGGQGLAVQNGAPRSPSPREALPVQGAAGRIRGRVTSADTGAPLRHSEIQLNSPQTGLRSLDTDADGRFEFNNLPAGRYTLTAAKTGYLRAQYGQRALGPLDSGTPIELRESQSIDSADLQLVRGAVITGVLLDEFSEPVPDASVQALRHQFVNGQRQLVRAGRVAQTNDIGEFRLFGLLPGNYYLFATRPTTAAAPGGPGRGGVLPLMVPVGSPVSRGARNGAESVEAPDARSSGYAPTYYPGASTVAEAQAVSVAPGDQIQGLRFVLLGARLFRVAGVIRGSDGSSVGLPSVELRPANGAPVPMRARAPVTISPQGEFALDGVPPGDYVLQVRMMRRGAAVPESADLAVTVGGSDIDNLVVTTAPGTIVSGRLVVKSGRATTPSSARVSAWSLDANATPGGGARPNGPVEADGSFEVRNVSGAVVFRVAPLPPGLSLSAVRLAGADITDTPQRFKSDGRVSGLEIELTDVLTHIDGTVTDERGELARDYAVIVFADDVQRWVPYTRFVRAARAGSTGEFAIEGLPPGPYLAIALDHLERGAELDPILLAQVKPQATSVTLDAGQKQRLALKLLRLNR
jgi:hypothetical protein